VARREDDPHAGSPASAEPETDTADETSEGAVPGNGKGGMRREDAFVFHMQEDAPPCHECGAIMVRGGACYKCLNCGATSGCS
jgi:hypothetical protein